MNEYQKLLELINANLSISDLVIQGIKLNPLFLHDAYDYYCHTYMVFEQFDLILEGISNELPLFFNEYQLVKDNNNNTLFMNAIARYDYEAISVMRRLINPEIMEQVWVMKNNQNKMPLTLALELEEFSEISSLIYKAPQMAIQAAFDDAEDGKSNILHALLSVADDFEFYSLTYLLTSLKSLFERCSVEHKIISDLFIMCDPFRKCPLERMALEWEKEELICGTYVLDQNIQISPEIQELAKKAKVPPSLLYFFGNYIPHEVINLAVNLMIYNVAINKLSPQVGRFVFFEWSELSQQKKQEVYKMQNMLHYYVSRRSFFNQQKVGILHSLERFARARPLCFFQSENLNRPIDNSLQIEVQECNNSLSTI